MIWSEVELSALIVCSCIPSLRQVVQRIPFLNRALGLSSNKTSQTPYGHSTRKTGSIPLHSYSHRDYTQSQNRSKNGGHHGQAFGMTSRAVAGGNGLHSKNDSQEEIFPQKTEGIGAIMVTHEVTRDVESTASSTNGSLKPSEVDHAHN